DLAQVQCSGRNVQRALRRVDREADLAHPFHVRGPLLDERHVEAGRGEIGADRGTVSARAEDGDALTCHGESFPQRHRQVTVEMYIAGRSRPKPRNSPELRKLMLNTWARGTRS